MQSISGMQNTVKKSILNSTIETAVHFLENDMNVKVLESIESKNIEIKEHFSAVNFSGKIDLTTLCLIDEELLKTIYKVFIPHSLSASETKEMLEEMPNEVINIIAGLSISKFPKPYDNLTMSPPSTISKEDMEKLLSGTAYISKEIQTEKGSLHCIIIG